jgi:alpha/beta superfamily hydrolase
VSFRPPPPEPAKLSGPAGPLEAVIEVPQDYPGLRCAIVCHPHPLHGGTLTNKVVHMTARALQERGYATVRFNFRGVGASAGRYDDGRGETGDALAVLDEALRRWPGARATVAGFSFGAYVAYRVANERPIQQLITIAPPVARFDFHAAPVPAVPWLVIQGDADEVVDPGTVRDWARDLAPAPTVVMIAGASHFFHGQLVALREAVQAHLIGD